MSTPPPCFPFSSPRQLKQYATQLHRLEAREAERFGTEAGVQVDLAEVEALVREHWRGRSARQLVGGNDKGLGRAIGHLALTRWDAAAPATPGNLVLLTREEADAHDALFDGATDALRALRSRDPEFVERVEATLRRVRLQFE